MTVRLRFARQVSTVPRYAGAREGVAAGRNPFVHALARHARLAK